MSVRYCAGIVAGIEISKEDAESIDYEDVITADGQYILGFWLYDHDDYDGEAIIDLDKFLLTQGDIDHIRFQWGAFFPERVDEHPQIKKYFVYNIN